MKRTFDGTNQDVWSDFVRYNENITRLTSCTDERKWMVFLTTLRGQSGAYVHSLLDSDMTNWNYLLQKIELRFGYSDMKESYLVEEQINVKLE